MGSRLAPDQAHTLDGVPVLVRAFRVGRYVAFDNTGRPAICSAALRTHAFGDTAEEALAALRPLLRH